MRVWDFPIYLLCPCHACGQHKEIHDIFSILNKGPKSPYYKHPEVQRWIRCKFSLWLKHENNVQFLKTHKSPIAQPKQSNENPIMINTFHEQLQNIKAKSEDPKHKCRCDIDKLRYWIQANT